MDQSIELLQDQPAQPDQYHGVGGSYIIDPATGQRRLYKENEHLLIKPARLPEIVESVEQPTEPAVSTDPAELVESEQPETNKESGLAEFPARKRKSKRGDK